MTLIQTQKITRFPVVLIGSDYWKGLIDWVRETLVENSTISKEDVNLFRLTDDHKEAVDIIYSFYQKHTLRPNF